MKVQLSRLNSWLFGAVLILTLLYFGRALLVPVTFSLLLWGVLNALAGFMQRFHMPGWLAWLTAFVIIAASLYGIVLILTNQAAALSDQIPAYVSELQAFWSSHGWLRRLLPRLDLKTVLNETDIIGVVTQSIGSVGNILFNVLLVAVYVGFLLAEQRYLPGKLARIRDTRAGAESEKVFHLIGRRIQSYLGVCTLLGVAMGAITYALLASIGLDFAGFWALMMFVLTYIPVVGAIGAAVPALMVLLQFGSFGTAFLVLAVLSAAHFILTDIIETVMLGYSMNLSPFVIMVALTFWGLVWGIPGLFLAVPLTSAFSIACRHLEGLEWIADAIAGPPRWHHHWSLN